MTQRGIKKKAMEKKKREKYPVTTGIKAAAKGTGKIGTRRRSQEL